MPLNRWTNPTLGFISLFLSRSPWYECLVPGELSPPPLSTTYMFALSTNSTLDLASFFNNLYEFLSIWLSDSRWYWEESKLDVNVKNNATTI